MQVYPLQIRIEPGGRWHRRLVGNGGHHTACGIDFGELAPANRDFKLDDEICEECHSRLERKTGEMKALKRELAKFPDDLPESKRPKTEDRAPRRREPRDTERDLPPFPDEPDDG